VDAAYEAVASIAITENSPMPAGVRPMGEALTSDGRTLYVSTGRGGSVAVVDVASRAQIGSIDGVGDRPWGIALSPDGKRLFTANGTSGDLGIVDVRTGNVDRRVRIGGLPWGVVIGEPHA
jgi:YVTN family beta-propeller protein